MPAAPISLRLLAAFPLGLAVISGSVGCVAQKAYDDAIAENRTLTSRNAELASRLRDVEQTAGSLRANTSGTADALGRLRDENSTLRQELAGAQSTITRLEEQLGDLEFAGLDPTTDAALRRLAERFPSLVAYDADRGLIRFASDLTFDSGSAVVKDTARPSLEALAQVLRTPEAAAYDTLIVGHTDSQRVSASTQQRHPSNMHLSVHRAIAVRDALEGLGVQAPRMQAAGWGEFRPAVPNTPTGNTPANRRVEILLVPSTANSAIPLLPAGSGAEIDNARLGTGRVEPTK